MDVAADPGARRRDRSVGIDFNFVQEPLGEGLLSDVNWAQFALTSTIWFVAPVAFGVRRLLRAEIK